MTSPTSERLFLQRWKHNDFSRWNEPDIREEFVTPLLHALGYSRGTVADILREEHRELSEPYHRIGRDKIKVDYIPTFRKKTFWIIEAKPGTPKTMDFGDVLQAHLYAIHPEINARFIVLTNGWSVRIYDALTVRSYDDTIHIATADDCEQTFPALRGFLSAQAMLAGHQKRVLQVVEEALSVEIDVQVAENFLASAHNLVERLRPIIETNARHLQIQAYRERTSAEEAALRTMRLETLINVGMDIPTDARLGLGVELVRRVLAETPTAQSNILDSLAMRYRGRPHSVFRVLSAYVFLRLVQEKLWVPRSTYVLGTRECLKELVSGNSSYWSASGLSNALCHLDNASLRLAKKLANRLWLDRLADLVKETKASLALEDRIKQDPSVARYMISVIGLLAEYLWRGFASASSEQEVWEGIWTYECIEKIVDHIPSKPYPDGDGDLLFFEHYGRGHDLLRVGTWQILNRPEGPKLSELNLSQDVVAFASLSREEVVNGIPAPKQPPAGWSPTTTLPLFQKFRAVLEWQ